MKPRGGLSVAEWIRVIDKPIRSRCVFDAELLAPRWMDEWMTVAVCIRSLNRAATVLEGKSYRRDQKSP